MMMLFAEIPVYVTVKGVFRGIGLGHGCISMIAPLCLRTEHTLPNLATASRVSKPQALHPYSPFPGSFMPLQDHTSVLSVRYIPYLSVPTWATKRLFSHLWCASRGVSAALQPHNHMARFRFFLLAE